MLATGIIFDSQPPRLIRGLPAKLQEERHVGTVSAATLSFNLGICERLGQNLDGVDRLRHKYWLTDCHIEMNG